ncbi:MAG: acylphosphatase [Candidatus Magasanikbacteria bacterium]|nr:acylphosphatase [Candidatus Magasanikbacteria bacterium]
MKKRIEAIIKGSVQGVGFRYYCHEEAKNLGLTGFAANLPCGKEVRIIAEGDEESLDKLALWLRHGPQGARVEAVEISENAYLGEFSDFKLL